ncbi:unnamed protein product [Porites evermanni]|uniref:Uncharacterized protein n=1 Tax=Porites evermanni TaxID=104178 RepID=A0ABN8PLQ7_9CNID|nr:unnamed protein product [Porites evermanni]
MYESSDAQAIWDVPVFAEHTIPFIIANSVDARFEGKKVWAVEMSCQWV